MKTALKTRILNVRILFTGKNGDVKIYAISFRYTDEQTKQRGIISLQSNLFKLHAIPTFPRTVTTFCFSFWRAFGTSSSFLFDRANKRIFARSKNAFSFFSARSSPPTHLILTHPHSTRRFKNTSWQDGVSGMLLPAASAMGGVWRWPEFWGRREPEGRRKTTEGWTVVVVVGGGGGTTRFRRVIVSALHRRPRSDSSPAAETWRKNGNEKQQRTMRENKRGPSHPASFKAALTVAAAAVAATATAFWRKTAGPREENDVSSPPTPPPSASVFSDFRRAFGARRVTRHTLVRSIEINGTRLFFFSFSSLLRSRQHISVVLFHN